MASTDEKIGRKRCTSWGPPRTKFGKRKGAKGVRQAVKDAIRKFRKEKNARR